MKQFLLFICVTILMLSSNITLAQSGQKDADFTYGNITEPSSLSISNAEAVKFSFPITSQISYTALSQFQTSEGKDFFKEALQLDERQRAIEKELNRLRKEYADSKSESGKKHIGEEILHQEEQSHKLYQESEKLKLKSNQLEYNYWVGADDKEVSIFVTNFMPKKVTYASINDYDDRNSLNAKSKYPIYNKRTDNKALVREQKGNDSKLVYKIQVGRYKTTPKSVADKFKKLSFIRRIDHQTNESGETIYTVGKLTNYEDAQQMQVQLEKEGFTKTKIIAFQGDNEVVVDADGNLPETPQTPIN
ncbi:MAG: hypothetical protein ACK5MI_09245 [Mangrovibacterium sp.]